MRAVENRKKYIIRFDPRTKIILLIISMIVATTASSLSYESVLIMLIAFVGLLCGKIRYSLIGAGFFMVLYFFTDCYLQDTTGTAYTMFTAWLSLVYKVYPCGMLAGIAISTTRVNEFLSAMNKVHIPSKVVIPLAVMLRYIPTIREDWNFIKDAMRLRDVSPSIKGFLLHPKMTIECLYSPLLMAASKAADELAIASVTRGIENSGTRTCLIQIRFQLQDILIIFCFLMMMLVNFISLEKTPTSISGEYRNKYVSVGVQSPTEIKASGGLQECADENVSKADAHSAARTLGAFLKGGAA